MEYMRYVNIIIYLNVFEKVFSQVNIVSISRGNKINQKVYFSKGKLKG